MNELPALCAGDQRIAKIARAAPALLGVVRKTPLDRSYEILWRIGRADAQWNRRTLALLRESLGWRRRVERQTSPKQQKPEHAERVDLAARIELGLAEHLLRRHEVRRAPRLARGIDAEIAHGKRGDAEVDEANAWRDVVVDRAGSLEQHVLGLEIAVQHAFAVNVRERVGDLDEDSSNFVGVERLIVREAIGERLPADVGHDHVDHAVRLAEREQRHHRRMAQVRDGARFAEQALAFVVAPRAIAAEHFDRDEAVEVALAREVDRAECTGAKRANDLIAVAELPLDGGAIVFGHSDKLAAKRAMSRTDAGTIIGRLLNTLDSARKSRTSHSSCDPCRRLACTLPRSCCRRGTTRLLALA